MRNQTDQGQVRVEEIRELVGLNDQAVGKLVEAVAMGKLAGRCPWVKAGSGNRPPCLEGPGLGLEDGGD